MTERIPQEREAYVVLSYDVDTQEASYSIVGGEYAYERAVKVADEILAQGVTWTASVYEIPYVPVYGTHKEQHDDIARLLSTGRCCHIATQDAR
jgi:hypothetical protein